MRSAHIRETLYCFGEVFNGFVRITVFDTVPDTVLDVSLQNNLSAAVQKTWQIVLCRLVSWALV